MGTKSGRSRRISSPSRLSSHPPAYRESANSRLIIAETTTTTTEVVTTTTTHTTTHFFSQPPWKKRGNPLSSSSQTSNSASDTVGNVVLRPALMSGVLKVDKDLPPTPSDILNLSSDALKSLQHSNSHAQGETRLSDGESSRRKSPPPPSLSRKSSMLFSARITPQATSALARASLGVGLPHVIPQASISSSEINSVAFVASPSLPSPRPSISQLRPTRNVRRPKVKSSYETSSEIDKNTLESRRNRGLSLGAAFFNFGNPSRKEKDTQDATTPQSASKPLSRRPSFWSRKKSGVTTELSSLAVSPVVINIEPLPLPEVHPVSPFDIDLCLSSSEGGSDVQHIRGLSRSHSERVRSSKSANDSAQLESVPQSHSRRPSTGNFAEFPVFDASSSSSPSHPPLLRSRPNRTRAQTNPPFLHRLSTNIFSSSAISTSTPSNASPSVTSPRSSLNRIAVEVAKPHIGEESPEIYLNRLVAAVSKAEITMILASSGDPFYVDALRSYIKQFNFLGDPLDVALRKLLMDVSLPRETQQIDRVIEAFADRYMQCNPGLFTSDDHPYILAFSLIMLHTDAFNKSNKRKMTKADYIKNTRLPGVFTEVLDCFYDNIVFAPFIFIEDPLDVNGQRGLFSERTSSRMLTDPGTPTFNPSRVNIALPSKGARVDPYFLITQNMLDSLRVNVEAYIPLESPYSYEGTAGPWNDKELQQVFAKANVIEVAALADQRIGSSFNLGLGDSSVPLVDTLGISHETSSSVGEIWALKVAKAGVLNRKDDVLEGGKKATNRKWRPWGVILTGSQLLLFRDPAWATHLLSQSGQQAGQVIFPETTIFKPEELLTVRDAIAVFDRSYTKHENTMRFVMPDGRHILLQAPDEKELNEWISRINYASAFKSAGVRMRALGMSSEEFEMTGVAAATSHLHDTQQSNPVAQVWDGDTPHILMDMLTGVTSSPKLPPSNRKFTMMSSRDAFDFETPASLETEGADQFKATFEEVKAELASGNWRIEPLIPGSVICDEPTTTSGSLVSENVRLPSRSEIIHGKVRELNAKISATQTQLDSHLRFFRNVATLTPFRKSTRDRLEVAVRDVAKKVMHVRLDMARLVCHREVLSNDLAAAGRDLHRAKSMALKTVAEALQGQEESKIPQMTLSFYNHDGDVSLSQSVPLTRESSHRAESTCESFHSALDFGPEWPSSPDEVMLSGFLGTIPFEVMSRSNSSSSVSLPSASASKNLTPSREDNCSRHVPDATPSGGRKEEHEHHEKYYTARESTDEQAEEWNKTRAAQRVSLVRLPSGFQMSALFEKHGQAPRTMASP